MIRRRERLRCARVGCKRRVLYEGTEFCSPQCHTADVLERELEARGLELEEKRGARQQRLPW